jgi:hypothetical protein
MAKKAQVTTITKKYKDRKTGEMKEMTINYSKVKDRLKEFRQDCPHGSIVTEHTILTDRITFRAHIIKDKSDPASAEATGHATGKDDGSEKIFEKLETIAVGRALALLGYASDGEIASSEEMEEFLADKEQRMAEAIFEITERIGTCDTVEELKKYWTSLSAEMIANKVLVEAKNARYREIIARNNEAN